MVGPEPETTPSHIGRFTVLKRLGSGGMGVVYAAYDPDLDRKVALKVLRTRVGQMRRETGRARLLREAQAMAKLSHPNVVAIYDVGTLDDQVFLAMEFVKGTTLTKWMQAEKRSWREVLGVFMQAGRGLSAAPRTAAIDVRPASGRTVSASTVAMPGWSARALTCAGLSSAAKPLSAVVHR